MNSFKNILKNQTFSLNSFFEKSSDLICLDKTWSREKFENIEIKKSFLRSLLRFSSPAKILLKDLTSYVVSKNLFKNNIQWYTKLYPMIHLPNDIAESVGGFHYDQGDDNNTFTCWIPITNYNYKALSICKYDNFITKLLAKPLIKTKIVKFFTDNIDVEAGDFYIWSGSRIHAGNHNVSKKISCAFQMKFTNKPASLESSYSLSNIGNQNFFDKYDYDNTIFLRERFSKYNFFLEEIFNLTSNEANNIEDLKKKINKFNFSKSKDISFALSILSQRLRSMNVNFKRRPLKDLINLDIASLLTGSENLISLKKIKI